MNSLLHILYIGNENNSVEALKQDPNFELTVVHNNLTAVNYLNSNNTPDAIICDYKLPGNNGLFLFDWLKENNKYSSTPFILLVKEFNVDLYKQAFKKKVDDFYVLSPQLADNLKIRLPFICNYKKSNKENNVTDRKPHIYKMPLSKRLFDVL